MKNTSFIFFFLNHPLFLMTQIVIYGVAEGDGREKQILATDYTELETCLPQNLTMETGANLFVFLSF